MARQVGIAQVGPTDESQAQTYSATLRERRQLTLPREVCEQLEAKIGDRLLMTIEDKTLILRPSKQVALDALREIQRAFAASGITEEELQESGRQIRRELIRERYGIGE